MFDSSLVALLDDPEYRKRFRQMWFHDKKGFSLARIKRWLRIMDDSFSRDLKDMVMTARPLPVWEGETLQDICERLLDWQARPGGRGRLRRTGLAPRTDAEAKVFASFPNPVGDDCDFILHLLRHFDTDLRWYVLAANDDEERMARVPAEFWGVEQTLGTIEPGRQADLILIDPNALSDYDSEANTVFEYREALAAKQMLNRSDGVVTDVWIAGTPAWRNSKATEHLGATHMGSALTVQPSSN